MVLVANFVSYLDVIEVFQTERSALEQFALNALSPQTRKYFCCGQAKLKINIFQFYAA